jgi:hypothetical protein
MIPMMSDSFMIRSSSPSILTSVPDHLPKQHPITFFDIDRNELAGFVAATRADGNDLTLRGFFLGGVRDDDDHRPSGQRPRAVEAGGEGASVGYLRWLAHEHPPAFASSRYPVART